MQGDNTDAPSVVCLLLWVCSYRCTRCQRAGSPRCRLYTARPLCAPTARDRSCSRHLSKVMMMMMMKCGFENEPDICTRSGWVDAQDGPVDHAVWCGSLSSLSPHASFFSLGVCKMRPGRDGIFKTVSTFWL